MRLVIAGVGRLKAGPERDLLDRYVARCRAMARQSGVTGLDVWDVDEGRGRAGPDRKREEASALQARFPVASFLVVFDESGASLSSAAFASTLGRERDAGRAAFVLAVGGPDGVSDDLRVAANLVFAFGAATLPHGIVRVLVAEQAYRALTILTGHPYHRA